MNFICSNTIKAKKKKKNVKGAYIGVFKRLMEMCAGIFGKREFL